MITEIERQKRKDSKKRYQEKYPEKFKAAKKNEKLVSKYGIRLSEFNSILQTQNGECKCCGNYFTGEKNTHVDYLKETKKVRGLICMTCNIAIGIMEKDLSRVDKILNYISKER